MRLLIQRVKQASVAVDGQVCGQIGAGLLIFAGFSKDDEIFLQGHLKEMDKLIQRIPRLRIWPDEDDRLNRCLLDIDGAILLVSQFTLYANCKKGTRPSFSDALSANLAAKVYELLVQRFRLQSPQPVESGRFQAYMQVSLINDGPFTLFLESKNSRQADHQSRRMSC